jgi:hypothetical protein
MYCICIPLPYNTRAAEGILLLVPKMSERAVLIYHGQLYWSKYVATIFNPVIVYGYADLRC